MTQPAKVQEPSMEEILASIRRIIADDEAKPPAADNKPAAPAAAAAPAPAPAPESRLPGCAASEASSEAGDGRHSTLEDSDDGRRAREEGHGAGSNACAGTIAACACRERVQQPGRHRRSVERARRGDLARGEIRPAQPEPEPEPEVFELTDDMAVPNVAPPQPSFQKVDPEDDLEFAELAASRAINRPPAYEPPAFERQPFDPAPSAPAGPILSKTTVSAVESAFNTLAHTVLSNNARTLEDLVKEMLRPMLKSWLDDNLPGLVERIVKAEIERVSRGR